MDVEEIVACLPRGRTLFHYFPGRYALMLLGEATAAGQTVHTLRRTRLGALLDTPAVRPVVARLGGGHLRSDDLSIWPAAPQAYRLTLGSWLAMKGWRKGYLQTSRPGANLVLQVNFSNRHNRPYRELLDPDGALPFVYRPHPVARSPELTLAWARLDVDLRAGEALIEELQSDWVRLAGRLRSAVAALPADAAARRVARAFRNPEATTARFQRYLSEHLEPHARGWHEVTLAATLWFLRHELGIRRVYMHTYESGNTMKQFLAGHGSPPRSLYSELPRRFCFERTEDPPRLLASCPHRTVQRNLRTGPPRWFVHQLA